MYFRRDTDYALRIMICLGMDKISGGKGLKLSEICRETNSPMSAVKRITDRIVGNGFAFFYEQPKKIQYYYLSKSVEEITLTDIFRAAENSTELFGSFEKENSVYKKYSGLLPYIENTVYRQFESITLYDVLSEKYLEEKIS